jgi:hypothetical protein
MPKGLDIGALFVWRVRKDRFASSGAVVLALDEEVVAVRDGSPRFVRKPSQWRCS